MDMNMLHENGLPAATAQLGQGFGLQRRCAQQLDRQ
jgi:hypothetical protein